MDLVQRAASGRCGILVCGERGSGREMIARAIHAHGPRDCALRASRLLRAGARGSGARAVRRDDQARRRRRAGAPQPRTHPPRQPSARCRRRRALSRKRRGAVGARTGAAGAGHARPRGLHRGGPAPDGDRRPRDRVGGRVDQRGARRGAAPSGPPRAPLADPDRPAGAPAAPRRHPDAGDALPQGALPGQRQADQDAHPAGSDAAGGAPVARQRPGAQGPAGTA